MVLTTRPANLTSSNHALATKTIEQFVARAARLYEQESGVMPPTRLDCKCKAGHVGTGGGFGQGPVVAILVQFWAEIESIASNPAPTTVHLGK